MFKLFLIGFLKFFLVSLFRGLRSKDIERQFEYISIVKKWLFQQKRTPKYYWLYTPLKVPFFWCLAHRVLHPLMNVNY